MRCWRRRACTGAPWRVSTHPSACEKKRACVVDAGTEVGRHIARIFTGFLTREFGEEAFKVERVDETQAPHAPLRAMGAAR